MRLQHFQVEGRPVEVGQALDAFRLEIGATAKISHDQCGDDVVAANAALQSRRAGVLEIFDSVLIRDRQQRIGTVV